MDLIPYSKVQIESGLNVNEILSRISENTCTPLNIRYIKNKRLEPFEGEIHKNEFEIYRTYNNTRNPFLPIFYGNVISSEENSVVKLKIQAHNYILIGLSIAFIIFGFITNGYYIFENGVKQYYIIFPVLIYVFLMISFNQIKKDYLDKLYEIVEGESLIEL